MEAECLILCSLQGAGGYPPLLLHIAQTVLSILFPVLLPGSTRCPRIHFVMERINNTAEMLVLPAAHTGEEGSVTLCLALFPAAPFRVPERWRSEAWLSLRLGALCIARLLIMRLQVSAQTTGGII